MYKNACDVIANEKIDDVKLAHAQEIISGLYKRIA